MYLNRLVDDCTYREHLQSASEQSGILDPELVPVECPDEIKYLWGYFSQLHLRRKVREVITYSDIAAWSALYRVPISPFEMFVLDRLEGLFQKMQLDEDRLRKP